jgi:hypothetical protein
VITRNVAVPETVVAPSPGRTRLTPRIGLSRAALVVGALTVVALALRLPPMRDALVGDELFMFRIVHDRSLGDAWHVIRETEKTPPLFFLFAWGAAKLGDPTLWIRLPSLVFGTALVPLAYLLGLRTVGRAAGVVAAAFIALGPFSIFYATEGRAYSAIAFLAALSTLCLLHALDTNRRRWWVAYGLAVLAVVYTHYIGIFVLLAQAAWAFWVYRERLRELIVVHGLALLAFVPWIPSYLLQQSHSSDEARRIAAFAPPSLEYLAEITARVQVGHPFIGLKDLPGRAVATLAVGVIVLAAAAAVVRLWRRGRGALRLSSPVVLIGLLAVATPAGVALISVRPGMSFMLARNLSPSLVAIALLVAWLLVSLHRRAAIPAVAVVLAALTIGAVQTLDRDNRRPAYRDVAHFIDARARPGDPVIQHFFVDPGKALGRILAVNFDRPHPLFPTGMSEAPAWKRGRRGAHVFVVLELPGFFRESRHLPRLAGPGNSFIRVAERRYPGIARVLVAEYELRGG